MGYMPMIGHKRYGNRLAALAGINVEPKRLRPVCPAPGGNEMKMILKRVKFHEEQWRAMMSNH